MGNNGKKGGGFFKLLLAVVLMVGFFYSVVYLYNFLTDEPVIADPDITGEGLPVLGSFENLQALMKERYDSASGGGVFNWIATLFSGAIDGDFSGSTREMMSDNVEMALDSGGMGRDEAAQVAGYDDAAPSKGEYSETNVQVEGVDEADIVKTDGRYIYQVNRNRVVVAEAYPPGAMEIKSILSFGDNKEGFYPSEMYLDEDYLVIIGHAYSEIPNYRDPVVEPQTGGGSRPGFPGESMSEDMSEPMPDSDLMIYPPPYYREGITKIKIFDIADRSNIKEVREIDVEGYYVSSRKIDKALYFVINKNIDYYYILREDGAEDAYGNVTPSYRDSAVSDEDGNGAGDFINITYDEIRYFPDFSEPNYMMVGGIDLERLNDKVELHTYLGAGENVYASRENLYIALTNYEYVREGARDSYTDYSTTVYQFGLDSGQMSFKKKGDVPGRILNQFAMDEYKDHLRIATTTGDMWRTDERTSKNNVYILDDELAITGKLEGIAPGESIFAVRYMGDRGYIVTFRTVDPLFVIDLKDPANPEILGELKIPGYSDYLHPYDENHLIGFGKEAVEVEQKDHTGRVIDTIALEEGMKMALFDVSDVSNPIEKFNETIGGRGTESSLLYNHRALLFDRERDIIAFPVTVVEERRESGNGDREDFFMFGEFVFQGAYIYGLDLEEGFDLRGKITHLSEADYRSAGQYWYDSDKNIERILFIRDALYTLSNSEIRASDFASLQKLNNLLIN